MTMYIVIPNIQTTVRQALAAVQWDVLGDKIGFL